MRGAIARAVILGAIVSVVFAAAAISAPVPGKAPSISGKPNFNSTLTCNTGRGRRTRSRSAMSGRTPAAVP
jgi:hypothetical protein